MKLLKKKVLVSLVEDNLPKARQMFSALKAKQSIVGEMFEHLKPISFKNLQLLEAAINYKVRSDRGVGDDLSVDYQWMKEEFNKIRAPRKAAQVLVDAEIQRKGHIVNCRKRIKSLKAQLRHWQKDLVVALKEGESK